MGTYFLHKMLSYNAGLTNKANTAKPEKHFKGK